MARSSLLSLSALAFAASSVSGSALPQTDNVPRAVPIGDLGVTGRFTLPAVKINDTDLKFRARSGSGWTSTVDVGSNWYIKAMIGTPPKPFYFLGDSGAPNLSIESTLEPLSQQGNIPKYDPTLSSTAQLVPGMTYDECFGSGYCDNGVVYRDVFTVGQISVLNMHIMVQTDNNSPSNGIRSGNLGLNFDKKGMSTKPNRLPTWFETIKGYLDEELWTVDWHKSTQTGQFNFGYIDHSKYVGEIAWAPVVTDNGQWTFEVQGVQAGYDDKPDHEQIKWTLMLDTGSGGGTISRDVADLYWRDVPNSRWDAGWNNYLYPCGQVLPDFVLILADGKKVGIPDEGLRWKGENGWCATMLAIGKENNVMWGGDWIEKYFVIYDWANARVGMAKKASQ